jgi:hypothetical protein
VKTYFERGDKAVNPLLDLGLLRGRQEIRRKLDWMQGGLSWEQCSIQDGTPDRDGF